MNAQEVILGLRDPAPYFLCENLRVRGSALRYRVPLHYRPIAAFHLARHDPKAAAQATSSLPEMPSTTQLRALLHNNMGLGLWAPGLAVLESYPKAMGLDPQISAGSLIIFPPNEWGIVRDEFADWQFDGIEAAFEGLPYSFEDILLFAGPNFSPDRWFLILRGPMAGNVCWWSHDGDSQMDTPWAADIKSWGDRIFTEVPDVLGGVIRFSARHLPDAPTESVELYPLEYHASDKVT